MVAYNVVIGDTMSRVLARISGLQGTFFSSRQFAVVILTLFVSLPLCLHRC